LWTQGEIIPLRDWLNRLPDHVIYADPNLCLVKAWVLFLTTNDIQGAKSLLGHVETVAEQTSETMGVVYAIQAAYATRREEMVQAITLSHQALDLLAEDNYTWRSVVLLGMGIAYSTMGEIDTASHYLMEAIIQAEASRNVLITVIATYNLGRMLIYQGHLHQAAQMFRQTLARAEQSQMGFPIAMTAHIGLGYVFYEWDALETARDHFITGITECKHLGNLEAPIKGYMNLASIQLARHNIDEAIGMNYQAEQLAQRANLSRMTERVITHRARLWLYAGNITGAEHWAQKSGLTLQDEPAFLRETDYLTLAYIAVKQGKAEDALPLLTCLREKAEHSGRTHSVIGILAVEALAWQALDQLERAVICLEEALTLAEPGGFIRLFVDMGHPLATLLRHAASRGIFPGYIGRLLASVENNAPGQTTTNRQPLIDPLSDRELDVLRLMAEGLSNSGIASELVVAMSTVKTHVKKIYRKLNVTSRTLAVARAQELAIL
ncbi:MAG: LuxR C-terminal-related transcriptional regulator, partial [Anaerolineae bacterium]|nr:LuxR C-terminal-related transcriptional regulator [Anaerolineae bacterium]